LHTEPCHRHAIYILMTLLSTPLPLPLHIAHGIQRLYFHSNFTDPTNTCPPNLDPIRHGGNRQQFGVFLFSIGCSSVFSLLFGIVYRHLLSLHIALLYILALLSILFWNCTFSSCSIMCHHQWIEVKFPKFPKFRPDFGSTIAEVGRNTTGNE
jgi:hypothetical protein